MPQKVKKTKDDIMCYFEDTRLLTVVTVSEISYMWNKSKTSIMSHVYSNRFIARKSLSGGEWLVLAASVFAYWGKPVNDNLYNYYEKVNTDAYRKRTINP